MFNLELERKKIATFRALRKKYTDVIKEYGAVTPSEHYKEFLHKHHIKGDGDLQKWVTAYETYMHFVESTAD